MESRRPTMGRPLGIRTPEDIGGHMCAMDSKIPNLIKAKAAESWRLFTCKSVNIISCTCHQEGHVWGLFFHSPSPHHSLSCIPKKNRRKVHDQCHACLTTAMKGWEHHRRRRWLIVREQPRCPIWGIANKGYVPTHATEFVVNFHVMGEDFKEHEKREA